MSEATPDPRIVTFNMVIGMILAVAGAVGSGTYWVTRMNYEGEIKDARLSIESLKDDFDNCKSELDASRQEAVDLESEVKELRVCCGQPPKPEPGNRPDRMEPLPQRWLKINEPVTIFEGAAKVTVTSIGQKAKKPSAHVEVRFSTDREPILLKGVLVGAKRPFPFDGGKYMIYVQEINLEQKQVQVRIVLNR